mmetsp:Transcript_19065/g.24891  ORF Transcript_19065/g.24891 Transcript_19065/m.24891 type:complete len:460 (-) Transcript_19065:576-1955(-)
METDSPLKLCRNDERGAHFVATRDMPAGTRILSPGCIEEALTDGSKRCSDCKRGVSEQDKHCLFCSNFATCTKCTKEDLWRRHQKECRAFNALEMEFEEEGLTKQSAVAIETNARENLFLALRWTIHRSETLYGSDPWLQGIWRNGTVPGILLSHEDKRDEEDISNIHATANFILELANSHAKAQASVEEIRQFLQIVKCNGCGIMDPFRQESIGIGLYPSGCCFNHSCRPNCDYLPDANGRIQVVTIRPVLMGEEMTLTYTDNVTQSIKERSESLSSYFFVCDCERCTKEVRMDLQLDSEEELHVTKMEHALIEAENSDTVALGLEKFKIAVKEMWNIPEFHRLRWKAYHGCLIHAEVMRDWETAETAINGMLKFHDEVDKMRSTELLPVAKVGLLVKKAWVLSKISAQRSVESRTIITTAISALQPFGVDVLGLRLWEKGFLTCKHVETIDEILYAE